jgi:hypothetical protein
MDVSTSSTTVKAVEEYYVPSDPMDDLQCESCQ